MPINAHVFRCSSHGEPWDCTNDGISSKAEEICILNAGQPAPECFKPKAPAALIVKGNVPGGVKIVPADENGQPVKAWCMFGGNFAYSSDGRFHDAVEKVLSEWGMKHRSNGAVPIHDRIED